MEQNRMKKRTSLLLVCYSLVVQCSRYRAHGGKVWSHLPCNAPVMISIYPPRFSSMQCMQRGVESNAWAGSSDVLVARVGANQTLDLLIIQKYVFVFVYLCICIVVLACAWVVLGLTSRLISHHLLIIHSSASLKFVSHQTIFQSTALELHQYYNV